MILIHALPCGTIADNFLKGALLVIACVCVRPLYTEWKLKPRVLDGHLTSQARPAGLPCDSVLVTYAIFNEGPPIGAPELRTFRISQCLPRHKGEIANAYAEFVLSRRR